MFSAQACLLLLNVKSALDLMRLHQKHLFLFNIHVSRIGGGQAQGIPDEGLFHLFARGRQAVADITATAPNPFSASSPSPAVQNRYRFPSVR
ncbi:MAG: hypothetical protein H6557_11625 [Lewinellaceae bacterium]|nr:hypothetical protein [Lewinellaceae bacterium]